MQNKQNIQHNLTTFKRKYWLIKLIGGIAIFCGTALVWLAAVFALEYFAWLSVMQRSILFWISVLIVAALGVVYIIWPLFQIIMNGQSLSDEMAAKTIGSKIDGVSDKLLNYLQLKNSAKHDELVDASLAQKEMTLSAFRFREAVTFSDLKPMLLFLVLPVLLVVFFTIGNKWGQISEGANRLVNYNVAYQRTFPFDVVFEEPLRVEQGKDARIRVVFKGSVQPSDMVLVASSSRLRLQAENGVYSLIVNGAQDDLSFNFLFDEISSGKYVLNVEKKPALANASFYVIPPKYTGISPFVIQNTGEFTVPQGSTIQADYRFVNVEKIRAVLSGVSVDTIDLTKNEKLNFTANSRVNVSLFSGDNRLGEADVDVLFDSAPIIRVDIDSLFDGYRFVINTNDDYRILKSKLIIEDKEGVSNEVELPVVGGMVLHQFELRKEQVKSLSILRITARDDRREVSKQINLDALLEPEKSESDILGNVEAALVETRKQVSENNKQRVKSKGAEQKKVEAEPKQSELKKIAEKLKENDAEKYERFSKLSEEIEKLLDKLKKDLSPKEKQIIEKSLEETISDLEKEWEILKAIAALTEMDKKLADDRPLDSKEMEDLQKTKEDVSKVLSKEEKEKLNVEKYEEIKKANEELRDEMARLKGADESEENKKNDTESSQGDNDSKNESEKKKSDENKKKDDLKNQMKEDSDALKEQLSSMSLSLAMEQMEANIALIRRLELRSLKSSLEQEQLFDKTNNDKNVAQQTIRKQREIVQSTQQVLDSLNAMLVSNEKLSSVLQENSDILQEKLEGFSNIADIDAVAMQTNQRYLQYGLNDLASILYDILKSEQQQMQSMMKGDKQCNNPKPGAGKKPSLSGKQGQLGEKLGEMRRKGKGKPGKEDGEGKQNGEGQGQKDLLELIKGQEAILNELQKQGNEAGGQSELIDAMNKQLNDLINNNLDKAIERNKDIQDKLITLENSENDKEEKKEDRQSKTAEMDYEAIKRAVQQDYIQQNQTRTRVVNLPTLNSYYTGKWIKIGRP